MIKIYGHPATSAGRCHWLLEELEVPYENVPVDMKNREHKSQSYLELNPNGKVPTLQDDRLVLWESMAINFYLAEKYRPGLLGQTLEDRALVNQWSYWSLAEYQKPVIDLFIQKVFVPEEKRDASLMAKSLDRIHPLNELLDRHLRGRNFMVNHEFTLADLNVASVVLLNSHVGISLDHLTHLKQWFARVAERPSYGRYLELMKKR